MLPLLYLNGFLDPVSNKIKSCSYNADSQIPTKLLIASCVLPTRQTVFQESNIGPLNCSSRFNIGGDLETDNTVCNSHLSWFMASDELCLSLGSITNQAPYNWGRDSLTIIHG